MTVTSFAPAKINLYLHVAAPRADGLHPLDSLVMFAVDVGDVVSAGHADTLTLEVAGPFETHLAGEADNLILRAARLLAQHAGVAPRAALCLDKQLPVASGIGGGSSDAAAALRVLNRLWRVNASDDDLESLAATLGADVPVCVRARTARMQGTGAALTPAEAPALDAVLVNPMVAAATAAVYRAFDAAGGAGALDAPGVVPSEARAAIAWLARLRNDLEAPAQQVAPVIAEPLGALSAVFPQALVRMSGSGATCFALVENAARAAAIATRVTAAHPAWWVRTARLGVVDVSVTEG